MVAEADQEVKGNLLSRETYTWFKNSFIAIVFATFPGRTPLPLGALGGALLSLEAREGE